MSYSKKRIILFGKENIGKSYLVSLFTKDPVAFRKIFCSQEKHTKYFMSKYHFYTDDLYELNTARITTDATEVFQEDILFDAPSIFKKIGTISNTSYNISNPEIAEAFFDAAIKLGRWSRYREEEQERINYSARKSTQMQIDINLEPSNFCLRLMKKINAKELEIVEIPEMSETMGRILCTDMTDDFFLFLFDNYISDAAAEMNQVINQLKFPKCPLDSCWEDRYKIHSSYKAAYIVKGRELITNKEKYEKEQHKNIDRVNRLIETLCKYDNPICQIPIGWLCAEGNSLCFPPLDADIISPPEQYFCDELEQLLTNGYSKTEEEWITREFKQVIQADRQGSFRFIDTVLSGIPSYTYKSDADFTESDFFKAYQIDRVKTNCSKNFLNTIDATKNTEILHLYDYFKKFTLLRYLGEKKRIIVKYLYYELVNSILTDSGIGDTISLSENEDVLPMRVAEAILAPKLLLDAMRSPEQNLKDIYINVLKSFGVTSKTWNWVYCDENTRTATLTRWKILTDTLASIPAETPKELLLYRYIGSLRLCKIYNILQDIHFLPEEDISSYIVKKLRYAISFEEMPIETDSEMLSLADICIDDTIKLCCADADNLSYHLYSLLKKDTFSEPAIPLNFEDIRSIIDTKQNALIINRTETGKYAHQKAAEYVMRGLSFNADVAKITKVLIVAEGNLDLNRANEIASIVQNKVDQTATILFGYYNNLLPDNAVKVTIAILQDETDLYARKHPWSVRY